jgi:hypothetical protein
MGWSLEELLSVPVDVYDELVVMVTKANKP